MNINNVKERKPFKQLLFSQPTYFDVKYKINPYMIEDVNPNKARLNWNETIRAARNHTSIQTVDYDTFKPSKNSIKNLPDAVFCANHAMPIPDNGFVLSNMKHNERKGEPYYFEKWAKNNGYPIIKINSIFEGECDAKWHPNKNIVFIGYGTRTNKKAINEIDSLIDAKVIGLELISPLYYHLDICFTPLDEDTVLIIPEAFSKKAYNKIHDIFDTVFYLPNEDKKTMGGNCARISPNTFLIDKKNKRTIRLLQNNGYTAVEVSTEEFQKSGGSTDCLFINIP